MQQSQINSKGFHVGEPVVPLQADPCSTSLSTTAFRRTLHSALRLRYWRFRALRHQACTKLGKERLEVAVETTCNRRRSSLTASFTCRERCVSRRSAKHCSCNGAPHYQTTFRSIDFLLRFMTSWERRTRDCTPCSGTSIRHSCAIRRGSEVCFQKLGRASSSHRCFTTFKRLQTQRM